MSTETQSRLDGKKTAARTTTGRFAEGNPGGPGRPRRQTEHEYLLATMAACPLDAWQEIVAATVTAAKAGDRHAREWLGSYLLGEAKSEAPRPLDALADDEAGYDPVAKKAAQRREDIVFDRCMGM